MKRPITAYCLSIMVMISVSSGLKSQDNHPGADFENLQVFTDRTMYVCGENILFTAVVRDNNNIRINDLSRVMYCELITPDGNRIAAGKFPVVNLTAQGCLPIPEETITGIYYLKSYTRFMRNSGPESYSYIMLKIINPYKEEVISGYNAGDSSSIIFRAKTNDEQANDKILTVVSGKNIYSKRENVSIKINVDKSQWLQAKLCLSVIPELAWDGEVMAEQNVILPSGDPQYFPETRGISLTGRVLNDKTGRPVPQAIVNLSIIGDKDIMAVRTDSSGRYFFALPDYTGNRDIFLCAEDISGNSPEIFIDNDFCPLPVNLPSPVFHLSEKEQETAYKLAVNQKISTKFRNDTVTVKRIPRQNEKAFYGEPTNILVMDKYIDLPALEDYFNELPFGVKVRKSQGRKQFRFFPDRADMLIYDPLVLIDWVAVDDISKVLAMSPGGIDRIELVNSPFIKGNITYGGIISFVSRKNDFAGIDLPSSGTFINYKFLEECTDNIPVDPLPDNLPDSRNTIYWNPDVQTDEKGSADISFTVPDTPGTYIILLRGMSVSGEMVLARKIVEIK